MSKILKLNDLYESQVVLFMQNVYTVNYQCIQLSLQRDNLILFTLKCAILHLLNIMYASVSLSFNLEQIDSYPFWSHFRSPHSNSSQKQAFREFLVSPALIRNYKAVISMSFIWLQYLNQNCMKMFVVSLCCTSLYMIVADKIPYGIYSDGNFKKRHIVCVFCGL